MVGRRVYPVEGEPLCKQVGDYGKDRNGQWWIWAPNTTIVCDLPERNNGKGWEITEHDDGTISVSPSINFVNHWHGWLIKGEWVG